jgi:uncharacterized protein YecT (DUF1311 family)
MTSSLRTRSHRVGIVTLSVALLTAVLAARVAAQDIATGDLRTVRPADRAAVAECLSLVAAAERHRTEAANAAQQQDNGDPKEEKIDPAAWHKQAGERAAADETSCIGVVSDPCQETREGKSNMGMTDCMRRELAVWNERLNKAYKKWIDDCDEAKICAARRKLGRAWLAKRDARCALPAIEEQGSMAIPMTSFCMLDETAHQAIWVESAIQ